MEQRSIIGRDRAIRHVDIVLEADAAVPAEQAGLGDHRHLLRGDPHGIPCLDTTDERAMKEGKREAADLSVIGTRMRKVDGLAKSSGRAQFTDDITLPGMLHGKILRSPHPHANIVSIDTSKALALPGVEPVAKPIVEPVAERRAREHRPPSRRRRSRRRSPR